jgi:hypothetical protein
MKMEHTAAIKQATFVVGGTLALIVLMAACARAGIPIWPQYSPVPGVVCDAKYKFCADGTGLSATWTKQLLGYKAAKRTFGKNQSKFTFSNGVTCATIIRNCWGL